MRSKTAIRAIAAITSSTALLGCWASEGQLRMKAAADLDCPKDTLTVTEVGGGVHEVKGCGENGRYVYSEAAKTWLRESDAGGKVKN